MDDTTFGESACVLANPSKMKGATSTSRGWLVPIEQFVVMIFFVNHFKKKHFFLHPERPSGYSVPRIKKRP